MWIKCSSVNLEFSYIGSLGFIILFLEQQKLKNEIVITYLFKILNKMPISYNRIKKLLGFFPFCNYIVTSVTFYLFFLT